MPSERSEPSRFEHSPGAPDAIELRPKPPVKPGETVAEKYRVERVLGFGGMGVVCEATHLELGTKMAIKFVRPELANDERAVARFLTEARSAAQLRSQYACRVMDCGRLESGSPYLVMEYLQGADLRTIVEANGPFPVDDAVSFAVQACEALAEAHAQHLVHRDVKPENLFLTQGPDGTATIKVLDFGISKQLGRTSVTRSLTEPTESIGSPYHMSPEQMIDPTEIDARTDIWSLGVVLYELITGELPFNGASTPQVCANVMTSQPESPSELRSEVPVALSGVILRCLEKDRERRFADVGELSAALKQFGSSASTATAARVERILERARSSSRPKAQLVPEHDSESELEHDEPLPAQIPGLPRRRPVLLALAVLALIGVAGVFVSYRVGTPSRSEPDENLAKPSVSVSTSASAALSAAPPQVSSAPPVPKPDASPSTRAAKKPPPVVPSKVSKVPSQTSIPESAPAAPANSAIYVIRPLPDLAPPESEPPELEP